MNILNEDGIQEERDQGGGSQRGMQVQVEPVFI